MTKTTYKVEFGGREYTRKTEHTYTHAAYNRYRSSYGNVVTFHKTYAAAKRAAGAFGEVKGVQA